MSARCHGCEAEGSATPTDHGGQARARGPVISKTETTDAAALRRRLAWREHQIRALLAEAERIVLLGTERGRMPRMSTSGARCIVAELSRVLGRVPPEGWEPEVTR